MNARDKRGFTLIEVMVTLMILAFGMLASMIGIMAALDHSLINEMRNEAMKIAQEQEEAARDMPYANRQALVNQPPQSIYRQVRKSMVLYTVNFTMPANLPSNPVNPGTGLTMVQFTVTWNFKKLPQFQYVLQTIVRQS
jgi:prepilin-type N-terminal cleavage/methylation domain-containing protein